MYKPIIGLETHVELNTKTKMFCSCPNDPDERRPNLLICPICMGHPGTLPVINEEAVKKTIKTGLALNSQIPEYSKFDRKNYFYPDLPKGYQISQLYQPLCKEGFLEIDGRKIRIREVHLEEDTGRLVHPEGADYSLVDFNRAGIPLMELVTEPDITSAKEARRFAETLHLILHYLDVSDADMEKGQMRVEVNISLTRAVAKGEKEDLSSLPGKNEKLGTKVEIKNLNSFRSVERGIDYEIKRQTELLESGKKIVQETRGWDDVKGITVSQREKEEAHDYRYFPEPDLPPLHFSKEFVQKIKSEIPELPTQRSKRLKKEYGLLDKEAEIFVYHKDLGEYFEKVVSELPPNLSQEKLSKLIKLTSNYLISDLQGLLKGQSVTERSEVKKRAKPSSPAAKKFLITPENFAEFITLIYDGKISSKIAKMVLLEMFKTGADPSNIIEEKGLTQIIDETEIEKIIEEVINNNPKPIEDYKSGKETAFQFLVGQIMAKSKGKANPQMVNRLLKEILTKIK
ncbi:MAG: Asp-tRNA(Asn)/Glu-tRNA(Gln) amidotransferase subunit GatB [bacterium]|nr:Asp-tRNA(Asn)/Glu-tRNA(Gln) amidotransferase subunit GatB [bacterium]